MSVAAAAAAVIVSTKIEVVEDVFDTHECTAIVLLHHLPSELSVGMVGQVFSQFGKISVNQLLTRARGFAMLVRFHPTPLKATPTQAAQKAVQTLEGRMFRLAYGDSFQPWQIELGVNLSYSQCPPVFVRQPPAAESLVALYS